MLSIADDGVGLNVKTDPRSTGMGQRIVSAMASKLDASVERDPAPCRDPHRAALPPRRCARAKPASAAAKLTRLPDHLQPGQHDQQQAREIDHAEDQAELPEIALPDIAAAVIHRRRPVA